MKYSQDGTQYHIGLKEGDAGEYVLLPGDPKRCEKIAQYFDNPKLKGVTGQREYDNQKSDFCSLKTALVAFDKLLENAQFKHIILSYSTDGLMPLSSIEQIMQKYAKPDSIRVYRIPYRRYKSRQQTDKDELKELLVYMEKKCI